MIKIEDVMSVYSGRPDCCCCGCAGKHTYAYAHRAEASKHRGYEVDDDQVSDRTVKLIVNKMNRLFETGVKPDVDAKDFVSVVGGSRLYIAYFSSKKSA